MRANATLQRLFVTDDLVPGVTVAATREQQNYLRNVLRLDDGAHLLVFNGRDGEWLVDMRVAGRKSVSLEVREQTRPQSGGPDVGYVFAPLKRARLDYVVQKATEMGVAFVAPVVTARTQVGRMNMTRMQANVIEAAEQCGVLRVPDVRASEKLAHWLDHSDGTRALVFCDEDAPVSAPVMALGELKDATGGVDVLIGPEGGFAPEERERLLSQADAVRLSLGPRVMRADTAGIAVLALVNAVLGDWR